MDVNIGGRSRNKLIKELVSRSKLHTVDTVGCSENEKGGLWLFSIKGVFIKSVG